MLVLTRKRNESIVIDGRIRIEVLQVGKSGIRLGIAAPRDVRIRRGELAPLDWQDDEADSSESLAELSLADDSEGVSYFVPGDYLAADEYVKKEPEEACPAEAYSAQAVPARTLSKSTGSTHGHNEPAQEVSPSGSQEGSVAVAQCRVSQSRNSKRANRHARSTRSQESRCAHGRIVVIESGQLVRYSDPKSEDGNQHDNSTGFDSRNRLPR